MSINETEASIIREAAKRIVDGASLRSIIREFSPLSSQEDSEGNRKPMTVRGLRSVLLSPTTAGLRTLDDEFVTGSWEPIIERELWERVREALNDPSRKTSNSNRIGYFLSSIMRCEKCGGATTGRNWVDPRTDRHSKRYQCRKCGVSIDLTDAETLVTNWLFDHVSEATWQAWISSGKGWDDSYIETKRAKLALIDRQWNADQITDERWMTLTAEINSEIDAAMNNEPLDIPHVESLRDSWEGFTLTDKRRVLRQALTSEGVSIKLVPFHGSFDPSDRIAIA